MSRWASPIIYFRRTATSDIEMHGVTIRAGDPAVLIASSEKAIRELGWKPRYTQLDDIVRTAWAWHRKRYAP